MNLVRSFEVVEKQGDTRKGTSCGKVLSLEYSLFGDKFVTWDGELCPGVEYLCGLRESTFCQKGSWIARRIPRAQDDLALGI